MTKHQKFAELTNNVAVDAVSEARGLDVAGLNTNAQPLEAETGVSPIDLSVTVGCTCSQNDKRPIWPSMPAEGEAVDPQNSEFDAAATGAEQGAGAQIAGATNLIENGSFETFNVAAGQWRSFQNDSSGAWQDADGIEIWDRFGGATASDGDQFMELDHRDGVDSISQTVQTEAGQAYDLSLDLFARSAGGTDTVQVYWNGDLVDTLDPDSADWETFQIRVVGTGNDTIELREPANQNDGAGALIDNITLVAAQTSDDDDGAGAQLASGSAGDGSYNIEVTYVGAWTTSLKAAFQEGIDLIESFVIGDLLDHNGVDDLSVTATIGNAFGFSAYAYATSVRPNGLASKGEIIYDAAQIGTLQNFNVVDDFAFHEILHVLGFGTAWQSMGLVETINGSLRFTGENAIEAYNAEYSDIASNDTLSAFGVPVEMDGGSGTAGVHWDEGTFGNEILTGQLAVNNTVSNMTIAALEDMGYQTTYGLGGGSGDDTVVPDDGSEELIGGEGADTLYGGDGEDTITGGSGADFLEGGTGNDALDGGSDNDTVLGDEGDDGIDGGNGADSLRGGAGNDTLEGGFGDDTMFGDDNNDVLKALGGANQMFGGLGNDSLTGAAAHDTLNGGDGADTMDGGNSTDVFIVDGDDVVTDSGASGFDSAQIFSETGDTIDMSTWLGVERVNGNIGNDAIDASTHSIVLTLTGNAGNDRLVGGSAGDFLIGGEGNDTLIGGEGNNWFVGGTGDDQMTGGSGDEIFFIGQSGDVITDAGTGFDRAVINELNVSITVGNWIGVERVVGFEGNDTIDATGGATAMTLTGGGGADELTGTSFDDVFLGGNGTDIINGGGGNDTIDGGGNADVVNGGAGNDLLIGASGADSFVFGNGFGRDEVLDYLDGTDRLDFTQNSSVNTITDLQINQSGGDTLITLTAGGTDQIILNKVLVSSITASDFDFV